ncbi:MAG TPA: hypothetical protein VIP29_00900 [Nitrososphaeraceae archaeon]|nr:hypothetical protein [Nitrososphaeraceae archaeon]
MPSQKTFASGITNYSPYWINYEKDLKSPYFKYCGIFDSCLSNDITIFPFFPLTTHPPKDPFFPLTTHPPKNDDDNISPGNTVSSIIPFQLPFP